jgi:hypothetical protein
MLPNKPRGFVAAGAVVLVSVDVFGASAPPSLFTSVVSFSLFTVDVVAAATACATVGFSSVLPLKAAARAGVADAPNSEVLAVESPLGLAPPKLNENVDVVLGCELLAVVDAVSLRGSCVCLERSASELTGLDAGELKLPKLKPPPVELDEVKLPNRLVPLVVAGKPGFGVLSFAVAADVAALRLLKKLKLLTCMPIVNIK